MIDALNTELFLALNASAAPNAATVIFATLAAQGFIYLVPLLAITLWVWGSPKKRGVLVATGVALLASLATSWVISLLYYHPRPFMIGLGRTLLTHDPDNSFPSDHTTLLCTFGFGLLLLHTWTRVGWLLVLAGLATGWARIYVGVHFPFDILGSLMVSGIGASIGRAGYPFVEKKIAPAIEYFYEALLRVLRLPPGVFPRHPAR